MVYLFKAYQNITLIALQKNGYYMIVSQATHAIYKIYEKN